MCMHSCVLREDGVYNAATAAIAVAEPVRPQLATRGLNHFPHPYISLYVLPNTLPTSAHYAGSH
jgi:hypothetical protein